MIAFCVFGVAAGLGESRAPARPRSRSRSSSARADLNAAEQRFAADLALIVKLLQGHLTANAGLLGIARPRQRRPAADAHAGRNPRRRADADRRNRKVQVKMDELSRSLDESVSKIEKLRSNLADANDKAMRDPLTGLGNRRFFDDELDVALETARRSAC